MACGSSQEASRRPKRSRLIDRELMEELGITVQVGEEPSRWTMPTAWLRFGTFCTWVSETPSPRGQQVRWVRPESLNNYPFPAANARIIAALLDRLGAQEAST